MKYLSKYLKNLRSLKSPPYSFHRILRLRKKYSENSKGSGNDLLNLAILKGVRSIGQSDVKNLKGNVTKFSEKLKVSQDKISDASNKFKQTVENASCGETASKDVGQRRLLRWYEKMKTSGEENTVEKVEGDAEWRKEDLTEDISRPPKFQKVDKPAVMLVASAPADAEGFVMYNDQLGRNFCGSLKTLGDPEKFKEVCRLQQKDALISEEDCIDIPPGVKSRITISISPSNDCDSKIDLTQWEEPVEAEGASTANRGNVSVQTMPSICFVPSFTEEGANSMCNLPPIYSLTTAKNVKHPLLGGVMQPAGTVEPDSNSLIKLKKYWERISSQNSNTETFSLANTTANAIALTMPTDNTPTEGSGLRNVPSRRRATGGSSSDGFDKQGNNKDKKTKKPGDSGAQVSQGVLFNRRLDESKKNKDLMNRPPNTPSHIEQTAINFTNTKAHESKNLRGIEGRVNVGDTLAELESPNLMSASSSKREGNKGRPDFCSPSRMKGKGMSKGKGQGKQKRKLMGKRKGKDKRKFDSAAARLREKQQGFTRQHQASAAGVKRSSPPARMSGVRKPPPGNGVKEFFTSHCFWIRNSGAINFLLALIFGFTVYETLSTKKKDEKEKNKDRKKTEKQKLDEKEKAKKEKERAEKKAKAEKEKHDK